MTGGTLASGVYPLIHTTTGGLTVGLVSSIGLFNFVQPGYIGVLSNSTANDLSLMVYPGTISTLTWVGGVSANAWDIGGTANWTTGVGTTTYANPDYVIIDDTGSASPAMNMNAAVSPTSVTVSNNSETYTLGQSGNTGKITGGASLIMNGTSSLTLLTKNDYLGGTAISNGTVTLGDNASAANDGMVGSSGAIVNNGTMIANDFGTETINGAISGSGQLVQRGAGTLILAGNNSTYSGGISNSTPLQMGNGYTGTLGTGNVTNNSTLLFNVGPTPASIVAVNANITGTGGITNVGPGIVTLNGSNTYSGKTISLRHHPAWISQRHAGHSPVCLNDNFPRLGRHAGFKRKKKTRPQPAGHQRWSGKCDPRRMSDCQQSPRHHGDPDDWRWLRTPSSTAS